MFKAFIKDSLIYTIPSFLSRGLSLILVPLYTRVLNPADYGSLDLFAAFTSLINLSIALEVSQGVARYYSSETDPKRKVAFTSTSLWFTLFCYAVFSVISFSFANEFAPSIMGRENLITEFRVGILAVFFGGITYLIHNQFRWELRSKTFAIMSIIMLLVTTAFSFMFTYVFRWGLIGILIGQAAGSLAGIIYGMWHLRNTYAFVFDKYRLKEMLIFSIPLVPSSIAVFVSTYIDRLMINHFLTVSDVGLFGIGYRLASIIGLVMAGFQGAITPLVYSNYKDPDTPYQLARIFRVFIVFSLFAFLSLTIFSKEILTIMTTKQYYSASSVVIFLVPAVLLSQMYIFAPGIGITKRTKYFLYINIAGAILNTFLNWVLVPQFGINGAAIATLINYLLVFTTYMIISQKLYYVPHQWKPIVLTSIIIGIIAFFVAKLDYSMSVNIMIKIVALLVSAAVVLLVGLIKKSEIIKMYQMLLVKIGK